MTMNRRRPALVALLGALGLLGACASDQGAAREGGGTPAETELDDEARAALTAALDQVARLEARREAPETLAPFLDSAQPTAVRLAAVRALGRLEHIAAADLLFQEVADDDERVRAEAAFGLGQLDLALKDGLAAHDRLRAGVEQLLGFLLDKETDPRTRLAAIRALGRISAGKGLKRLIAIAAGGDPREARAAAYALGVAGARRQAPLKGDPNLLAVAARLLSAPDVETQRAAAYLVFRHKLPLPDAGPELLKGHRDAQTTIHLLRAVAGGAGPAELAADTLDADDWRVRTEAVRALATLNPVPTTPMLRALDRSVAAVAGVGSGPEAHVVRYACLGLINAPMDVTRGAFLKAIDQLKARRPEAACACAVAHDAQQARLDQVKTCAPDWPEDRQRRLGVEVAARSMISTREKAAWLSTALSDSSVRVRLDAANALADEQTAAAATAAAKALEQEGDPAVAGALLRALNEAAKRDADPRLLALVVDRFLPATTIEDAEPLIELGPILRLRGGPLAPTLSKLETHPVLLVRLAATDAPYGERRFGPIATEVPSALPRDLPAAAVLTTNRGPVTVRFERDLAPQTVANFARLATAGTLDNTRFHRVVADFVAQGGDPRGDGSGGPGYTITCENNDAPYTRGAVGMALAGKDTGGSQFFLTHSEQPHLDGRYTLFGRVEEGMEVMDALGPDDVLISVELVP
jgi:cyclophilin family peptidyl-prolyl cis-trans isomerase/HEAT repeat protein